MSLTFYDGEGVVGKWDHHRFAVASVLP